MKTINVKKLRWIAVAISIAIIVTAITPVFADENSDMNVAVDYLVQEGILLGDENGDLNLDKGLSRAELAMLLWRAGGMDNGIDFLGEITAEDVDVALSKGELGFTDVPEWAKKQVMYCKLINLVNGYSATEFGPNDLVSVQQLCTVILRGLSGVLSGDDWSYDTAVAKTREWQLMPDYIADSPVITRGDMAIIVYNAMMLDFIEPIDTDYTGPQLSPPPVIELLPLPGGKLPSGVEVLPDGPDYSHEVSPM